MPYKEFLSDSWDVHTAKPPDIIPDIHYAIQNECVRIIQDAQELVRYLELEYNKNSRAGKIGSPIRRLLSNKKDSH